MRQKHTQSGACGADDHPLVHLSYCKHRENRPHNRVFQQPARVHGANRIEQQTSKLGVGGSNPSERAKYLGAWRG